MKKPTFEEAFEELKQIADSIEEGKVGIDDLSKKIQRATELLKQCETTLVRTDEEIAKLRQSFENNNNGF